MQLHLVAQGPLLYTRTGKRKYLTRDERARFITAGRRPAPAPSCARFVSRLPTPDAGFLTALALTVGAIEAENAGFIAFRSLKKRGAIIIREVPVPADLLNEIDGVHTPSARSASDRLWPLSRSRAWQLVKQIMTQAGIQPGIHATPKGLRHGFGIHAIQSDVPLNLVQRWLGHARMETTAIYLQAIGDEERAIAARMWGEAPKMHVAAK